MQISSKLLQDVNSLEDVTKIVCLLLQEKETTRAQKGEQMESTRESEVSRGWPLCFCYLLRHSLPLSSA
jgi:hypothetical protein